MAQQALEEHENSTAEEEEELEPEAHDDVADDQGSGDADGETAETEQTTTKWAIRGAVLGAVAGGAAGAGIGALFARRPEAWQEAKEAISGNSRQVAQAAAIAAAGAVSPRRLTQLATGDVDGDRSRVVKQSAKEAGAAAAKAARDTIISLRKDAA
ncbi:MAG TPA: hypothetical protein VIR59_09215 [Gaiellaceae bacterium]